MEVLFSSRSILVGLVVWLEASPSCESVWRTALGRVDAAPATESVGAAALKMLRSLITISMACSVEASKLILVLLRFLGKFVAKQHRTYIVS